MQEKKCYFCDSEEIEIFETIRADELSSYKCPRCGHINLDLSSSNQFVVLKYQEEGTGKIISIVVRNEYERSLHISFNSIPFTFLSSWKLRILRA